MLLRTRLHTYWMALLISLLTLASSVYGQDVCQGVVLSDARLTEICTIRSGPASESPACTLRRLCTSTQSPIPFPAMCGPIKITSTLCLDATSAAAIPECSQWSSFGLASEAAYRSCLAENAMKVHSIADVKAKAVSLCEEMPMMSGCSLCNTNSCQDPLRTLSRACMQHRMDQCDLWDTFCQLDGAPNRQAVAYYCIDNPEERAAVVAPPFPPPWAALTPTSTTPAPVAPTTTPRTDSDTPTTPQGIQTPTATPLPGPTLPAPLASPVPGPLPPSPASMLQRCLADPSDPACATFVYPEDKAVADVTELCEQMPDMGGCSIWRACKSNQASGWFCQSMSLLATICVDMPTMTVCRDGYVKLCSASSVVQQCNQQPALPRTPGWSDSRKAVFDMCGQMPMEGCSACTKASCADPLGTLSIICREMPDMAGCAGYQSWCAAASQATGTAPAGDLGFFCGDNHDGHSLPPMRMYFHRGISETILWREWIPRTKGQYAGSIVAVMSMAAISMMLKTMTVLLTLNWKHKRSLAAGQLPGSAKYELAQATTYSLHPGPLGLAAPGSLLSALMPTRDQVWQSGFLAVITAVAVTLDYWAMLVAMTFNIGLFCAVICGYVLGIAMLAHMPENYSNYLRSRDGPKQPEVCPGNGAAGGVNGCCPGTVVGGVAVALGGSKELLLSDAGTSGGSKSSDVEMGDESLQESPVVMTMPVCCVSTH